jgi:hypothetical protein
MSGRLSRLFRTSKPPEKPQEPAAPIYKPLDSSRRQIRLLRIEPAKDPSHKIKCHLFTESLDEKPRYHALSYVWGNTKDRKSINLDGTDFLVTLNLYVALRRFRMRREDVVFWIDAICINQDDLAERSSQVTLMCSIYSGAEVVKAWVGEADTSSDVAISTMEKWTANMDEKLSHVKHVITYVAEQCYKWKIFDKRDSLMRKNVVVALDAFLIRPYWSRAWIVQELVLAPSAIVVCGQREILFDRIVFFLVLWVAVRTHAETSGAAGRNPDAVMKLWEPPAIRIAVDREKSIYPLVATCRPCSSTDPRDKLYSLLGLTQQSGGIVAKMIPDYAKPVPQVFVEFMRTMFEETGELRLDGTNGVGLAQRGSPRIPGLPSWATDYAYLEEPAFNIYGAGAGAGMQSTVKKAAAGYDPMALESQAIFVDTVTTSLLVNKDHELREDVWGFILDNCHGSHPAGIPRIQAFFRILAEGDSKDHSIKFEGQSGRDLFYRKAAGFVDWLGLVAKNWDYQDPKYLDFVSHLAGKFGGQNDHATMQELLGTPQVGTHVLLFLSTTAAVETLYQPCYRWGGLQGLLTLSQQQLLGGFWGKDGGQAEELSWEDEDGVYRSSSLTMFLTDLRQYLWRKSIFVTEKGYVGIGPADTFVGDEIVVLPACKYPLAVRKKDSFYQVVGICRVYGLMDSEAVTMLNAGGSGLSLREVKII